MLGVHNRQTQRVVVFGVEILIVLMLLSCPFSNGSTAPKTSEGEQVQWLRENAVVLRSIDPKDEDFSDLMPLKKAIGKARVVFLGEQSHGDGSTFLAKGRLIRFLHQEMGFDVLAWESGTYDCRNMEAALHSNVSIEEAADQGIFSLWGHSLQVQSLFEYARSTYATTHPLEMAGFDCQFSAAPAPERMRKEILDFLERLDSSLLSSQQKESIQKALAQFAEFRRMKAEDRLKFRFVHDANGRSDLQDVIQQLTRKQTELLDSKSQRDVGFYIRCLKNLEVFEREMDQFSASNGKISVTDNNIRDQRMGENIIWLAKQRYPDRKIIIWAASMHNSRNAPSIDTTGQSGPDGTGFSYQGLVTMGQVAHDGLGEDMYSIAFTAYEGKAAILGKNPQEIGVPPEGSLEMLLHQIGRPYLFVDFKHVQGEPNHWLHQPILARPLGYALMRADWTHIFDAMVYTETMIPSMPSTPSTEVPKPKPENK